MKKTFIIYLLCLFTGIAMISCKKEISDIPLPVEGLKAYSGRNRAKVEFAVPTESKWGKIFYGNGKFTEFTITNPSSLQNVIVEEIPEGEQRLKVVTINEDGAVSDPKSVLVNIFGSNYEQTLKPRKWVDQENNSSTSIRLLFENALTGETGLRVVFSNTTGNKDSVFMNNTQNMIEVNNIDTTKVYYYYSVYKPNEEAIDDFFSASLNLKETLKMNFKKDEWVIDTSSGEESAYPVANIIDNNSNSVWRSQNGGSRWVTIDMNNPKIIEGFYYIKTPDNNNGPRQLKVEVSNDKSTWTTVLETEVTQSYLRQQLPLPRATIARYFRVTVISMINPGATQAEIAEIDTYNSLNTSGDNGYTKTTSIPLVNAKEPYSGDGSNLLPAVGEYRMQKVAGWTHSPNAYVSFDNEYKVFQPFSAQVWGVDPVLNGKIYQGVSLEAGHYLLKFIAGGADGPVDIYGVAASGETLPDYAMVPSSPNTLIHVNLTENQNKTTERLFVLDNSIHIKIGVVFNLYDRFGSTGLAWTHFTLKGFELLKVE